MEFRLLNQSVDDFNGLAFASAVAKALNVTPAERVVVRSVRAGSVIVRFDIQPARGEYEVDAATEAMWTKAVQPGGVVTAAVEREYGPLTVTEVVPVDRPGSKDMVGVTVGVVLGAFGFTAGACAAVYVGLKKTRAVRVAALRRGPPEPVKKALTWSERRVQRQQTQAMTRHQQFVEKLLAQEYRALEEAAPAYNTPADALVMNPRSGVSTPAVEPGGGLEGVSEGPTGAPDGARSQRPKRTRTARMATHYEESAAL